MEDIRLEKYIEALYEEMRGRIPCDLRDECPMLKAMADVLITRKEANNKEIMYELGVSSSSEFICPCRSNRKEK